MTSWEERISQCRARGGHQQSLAPSPPFCQDHSSGPWGNCVAKIVSLRPCPTFAECSQPPI